MNTLCISHVKDVDGISAAAIVRAATGASVLLTDHDDLMGHLENIPEDVDQLVLCDMGVGSSARERFIDTLVSLSGRMKVTYIDHHYLPATEKKKIGKSAISLVHDTRECASMLSYIAFKDSVPEEARNLALYGAVTDYLDGSPMGRQLMEKTDRQFTLAEATLLSHAVAKKGSSDGFPEMLVDELADMKRPHQIDGVGRLALEQLQDMTHLAKKVARLGKKMNRLAYMKTSQHSTGNIAHLLIGAFDVPVGVSFRERKRGWCEVSFRSTSECRVHLGRTIGVVAHKLGGSGGGHRKAAGCRIPTLRLGEMLRQMNARV
jgi:RecJ-like exonuclease